MEIDPSSTPNCIGYALFAVGVTHEEAYVAPDTPAILANLFDRVDSAEEADAIAAIQILEPIPGDDTTLLQLVHMAAVDKHHAGYVSQRAYQGAAVTLVSIADAFRPYTDHSDETYELWHLKVRPPETA